MPFYIVPKSIGEGTKTPDPEITLTAVEVKSGSKVQPEIYYKGRKLGNNDFTLTSKSGNLKFAEGDDESLCYITITGTGNFTGSIKDVKVRVLSAAEVKDKTIKAKIVPGSSSFIYNGKPQTLKAEDLIVSDGKNNPLSSANYDVEYLSDTTNAGEVRVLISGRDPYSGKVILK